MANGTRWVGYSDMTALQMGLLAHQGAPSWAGPMACDDFGRPDGEGGVDDITRDCFVEAMTGALKAVGFRTEAGFDGLHAKGVLWGGNLAMLCSMLGTPHFPRVKGGILFVEDVNEHPYRVERCLLQLHQAGVLGQQKAVLLGAVSDYRASPLDRGYTLKSAVAYLRARVAHAAADRPAVRPRAHQGQFSARPARRARGAGSRRAGGVVTMRRRGWGAAAGARAGCRRPAATTRTRPS